MKPHRVGQLIGIVWTTVGAGMAAYWWEQGTLVGAALNASVAALGLVKYAASHRDGGAE